MRNAVLKWKNPTNKVRDFSYNDIRELIAEDKYPTLTIYPFNKLANSPIRNLPVVISIKYTVTDHFSGKDILDCITTIGRTSVNASSIKALPFFVFFLIYQEYLYQASRWQEYFYKELQAFCDTSESIAYWNAFQFVHNTSIKSKEKATWITICKHMDREFWTKFTISIRESLLPWMNSELYKRVKDSEQNKRINVDYDKQKTAMSEGNLVDKTLSSFDLSKIPEEDIDIIK